MDHTKLTQSLIAAADNISADSVSAIDFAELQRQLLSAAELIASLGERSRISQRLIDLLKSELAGKARAIARLQGRPRHVAERLISSEEVSLGELLELRQQIEEEFDQVFSRKLMKPTGAARRGEKPAETGVKH
jgi:hypothetical protein